MWENFEVERYEFLLGLKEQVNNCQSNVKSIFFGDEEN